MSAPAQPATDPPTAEGSESTWPVLDGGQARPVRPKFCRLHPVQRGRQSVLAHLKRETSQLTLDPAKTTPAWPSSFYAGRRRRLDLRACSRWSAAVLARLASRKRPG